jgi:hypothetical protein
MTKRASYGLVEKRKVPINRNVRADEAIFFYGQVGEGLSHLTVRILAHILAFLDIIEFLISEPPRIPVSPVEEVTK